jgi:hypothetical protein
VPTHTRTIIYLAAAGAIWFAEDLVFSRAFGFNLLQTAVVTLYFIILFGLAVRFVLETYRSLEQNPQATESDFPIARVVSMAPIITVLLGSFAALPIFMLVLIVGALF